jgi:predicted DNA-binding transcriptional regulator YafY
MRPDDATAARDLAARIHLIGPTGQAGGSGPSSVTGPTGPDVTIPAAPRVVTDAVTAGRVLRLGYADRAGRVTKRDVERLGYVGRDDHWYLIGWCRLRQALRAFRVDRIGTIAVTAEVSARRPLRREDLDIPYGPVDQLSLT